MATNPATQGRTVVVMAVDGNEPALNAFKYYIKYIHREENFVILAHAMQMPSMPSREEWEKTHKEARRASQTVEGQFADLLQENKIDGQFEPGLEKPGEFIIETATKHKANLIVMGTRQLSGVKRAFLGSVSDHVVHHAHCPVLVVRH